RHVVYRDLLSFPTRRSSDLKGLTEAKRVLAVLSPEFLQSEYTAAEWQAAFAKDPTGELGHLVPVRVAHCKPEGLLMARTYIDLVDRKSTRLNSSHVKISYAV